MRITERKGQMLIETMVALSMVVIGMLGLLALLSQSIGINKVVSDQYVASYLAAEGIELVKQVVDNNVMDGNGFNEGLTGCGTGCSVQYDEFGVAQRQDDVLVFDVDAKAYTYNISAINGTPTSFKRKITIFLNPANTDEMIVHSIVTWKTRGGSESTIDVEDHFFNWRA